MGYLANAGQFLISFAFGVLVSLVVIRVLLQLARANFYNPICQMLYKLTNPVLIPVHRLIPNWRNFDIAGVLLAWLLSAVKLALLYALVGQGLRLVGLMVMALADLIDFVLLLHLVLIFARVVLSFVSVERSNPIVPLIVQLTEPLLRPVRRRVPAMGGFDFSPAIVMLAIGLMRILLMQPLMDLGAKLAQAAI